MPPLFVPSREKYRDQIAIYLGFEAEYLPGIL